MMPTKLGNLSGRSIVAARPLNYAELCYEGDGATDGVLLDLGAAGAIVVVTKRGGVEARWQTPAGEELNLAAVGRPWDASPEQIT